MKTRRIGNFELPRACPKCGGNNFTLDLAREKLIQFRGSMRVGELGFNWVGKIFCDDCSILIGDMIRVRMKFGAKWKITQLYSKEAILGRDYSDLLKQEQSAAETQFGSKPNVPRETKFRKEGKTK